MIRNTRQRTLRPSSSRFANRLLWALVPLTLGTLSVAAAGDGPAVVFSFDDTLNGSPGVTVRASDRSEDEYVTGLDGRALRVRGAHRYPVEALPLRGASGYSVQFWVRSTAPAEQRMVLLSQKDTFATNDLHAHKRAGWAFVMSDGTWAWNIGSGERRLTYERDNGRIMRLNDGRWHQLTLVFDAQVGQARLYYDGIERAIYHLRDSTPFEFESKSPLTIGWESGGVPGPSVAEGSALLQQLVDDFNAIDPETLLDTELLELVVAPENLLQKRAEKRGDDSAAALRDVDLSEVRRSRSRLMRNPHTVHQSKAFMEVAPLLRLYGIENGRVMVHESAAREQARRERLDPPDFDLDELVIFDRPVTRDEVRASYERHFPLPAGDEKRSVDSITVGVWNIEHGGKHFNVSTHGWDSRLAIAEMIQREGIDVVLLQETYSSGDFLAAELGYTLVESVDWDYLNQGTNLSVLSRFPIEQVHVPEDAPFNNLAARIALSETRSMYVMSNWYGMKSFAAVFDYHRGRFEESDAVPVLFGGDFNAISHLDGGKSPASEKLLKNGFVDVFRDLHPDVGAHPGYSHRSGRRIDQLYALGPLRNPATHVVSTWPTGFPADHYLIVATFEFADTPQNLER